MLAATVDAEEAETTFLFSLLVFLRLLWCVPRRMAAFFFMALLLFFQILHSVRTMLPKVSFLGFIPDWPGY